MTFLGPHPSLTGISKSFALDVNESKMYTLNITQRKQITNYQYVPEYNTSGSESPYVVYTEIQMKEEEAGLW